MRKMTKLQQRIYDRVMKAVDYMRGVEKDDKIPVIVVDRDKLIAKWSPIIEKLGIKDPEKIKMLSEYAQVHSEHMQGTYKSINDDQFNTTLIPQSMKIYAQTVGLKTFIQSYKHDNDEIKQGSTDKD